MKFRRHHNNKATRSTLRGKRKTECELIAKRLKVEYANQSLREFIEANTSTPHKAKER